jgi:hypothetical protein
MSLALVTNDPPQENPFTFDAFWLLHPRKVARLDAEKAWGKLTPDKHARAIVAVAHWRKVWMADDLSFCPYPATWLRGERFDDELPEKWGATHASHVPAAVPAVTERAVMPEHVKALLAKLRNGNQRLA